MVNSAETRVSAEFTIQIGGRLFDRAACAIGAGSRVNVAAQSCIGSARCLNSVECKLFAS